MSCAPASDRLAKAAVQRPKPSRAPTVATSSSGSTRLRGHGVPWGSWKAVSHTQPCIAATLDPRMVAGVDVPRANPAHRRTHGRDSTAAVGQSRAGVVM
jgi:hypothetical protein